MLLPLLGAFIAIRVVDLAVRGQVEGLIPFDGTGAMWLLEMALFVAAAAMMRSDAARRDLGNLFRAALLLLFAGALYRFDVYLLAFSPGPHWTYFPNVNEILITVGLVAGEVGAYIVCVRVFPILAGRPQQDQLEDEIPAHPRGARGLS